MAPKWGACGMVGWHAVPDDTLRVYASYLFRMAC
jgi:hypothetical protein